MYKIACNYYINVLYTLHVYTINVVYIIYVHVHVLYMHVHVPYMHVHVIRTPVMTFARLIVCIHVLWLFGTYTEQ